MPDLPKKKVGVIACSGEELAEGTVTRLAALKVLEELRPDETVTICLPLFLAGGEQDRAFARFYPTIAVGGCEKRCAARGTDMHSGKPAAEIVVTDLADGDDLGTGRKLNAEGDAAADVVAERIAETADDLLGVKWNRRRGKPVDEVASVDEAGEATTETDEELMETVEIYTSVPEGEEEAYAEAVMRGYARYWEEKS